MGILIIFFQSLHILINLSTFHDRRNTNFYLKNKIILFELGDQNAITCASPFTSCVIPEKANNLAETQFFLFPGQWCRYIKSGTEIFM